MKQNAYQGGLAELWQARVSLQREDFPLIRQWLSAGNFSTKSLVIDWLFFESPFLALILHPARGRQVKRRRLSIHLASAYFACRHLVELAEKDQSLDISIECILNALMCTDSSAAERLKEAENLPDTYKDQLTVVLLVYWAFYDSWARYNVNGLPEPQEAFRQYLYGKKRRQMDAIAKARKKYPEAYEPTIKSWINLYLGERGAAAKPIA